ncbi:hypothetical protein [Deferrisoma camini]|uniref:hypothetical protein n=1 Tax=Deferrisoma camini TaxID=1035120 RepID=UPI00046D7AC1|nr:hypothetical protein [Deferrisoma camini]
MRRPLLALTVCGSLLWGAPVPDAAAFDKAVRIDKPPPTGQAASPAAPSSAAGSAPAAGKAAPAPAPPAARDAGDTGKAAPQKTPAPAAASQQGTAAPSTPAPGAAAAGKAVTPTREAPASSDARAPGKGRPGAGAASRPGDAGPAGAGAAASPSTGKAAGTSADSGAQAPVKGQPGPAASPPQPTNASQAGAGDAAAPPAPPPTDVGLTTAPTTGLTEVSGWVRGPDGSPTAGAPVVFWARAEGWGPGGPVARVQAEGGRYRVLLPDGAWLGTACGSPYGYAPLFWEVVIAGNEIVSYREVVDRVPSVRVARVGGVSGSAKVRVGDRVRVEGEGFGCSGYLVITQGGQEVARVERFATRTDRVLEFAFPAGSWRRGVELGFAYHHGRWRSLLRTTGLLPEGG